MILVYVIIIISASFAFSAEENAPFDPVVINEIHQILKHAADKRNYHDVANRLEKKNKISDLVDVIYDYDNPEFRIEAMWILNSSTHKEKKTVFNDIRIAEKNADIKRWAEVILRKILIEDLSEDKK